MTEQNTKKSTAVSGSACCSTQRRSFCKSVVAAGLGAVAIAPPVASGIRVVLSAPEQKGAAGKFYQLTTVDSLGQTPQKFLITDDIRDAWMTSPRQKIGAVFLLKDGDGKIRAIHSVCPHAGCTVEADVQKNPKTGTEELIFYCPCHAAHFDLNGVRLDEASPSPRDLDVLEVQIEDDGKVLVKFENYITGTTEKKTGG
ncbi:MAG: Rieske (2Fe-2S) protein [Planctomycetaceae bacterium]|nr:Rieske (2Fe-2S) protein [Planctomycetaceae bacterium]